MRIIAEGRDEQHDFESQHEVELIHTSDSMLYNQVMAFFYSYFSSLNLVNNLH